jgi:hypothetical protein
MTARARFDATDLEIAARCSPFRILPQWKSRSLSMKITSTAIALHEKFVIKDFKSHGLRVERAAGASGV